MARHLARAAFLLSGVAGLTFEIVWMRHLGLAVGATTLAVATTTAAYMGGLALGAHLGGRFADRLRRPLTTYGFLEIGIALVGLIIPTLCTWIPAVDEALFVETSGGFGRAMVRFVVATLVLILPTTAMGMTLPILARVVTERAGQIGREVGLLYALNIAGAMLGAALAGFVLIPNIGLLASNWVAVSLDFALGLFAVAAGMMLRPLKVAPDDQPKTVPVWRPGSRRLVTALGVTGAAAMGLQVLWTRALGTALGPSTYAFTAIVCAYLAGLGLGGAMAAWVADRVAAVRFSLALVLIYTGAAALVGIFIIDDLPMLLHGVVLDETLTMGGLVRSEFVLAALSVVPATIGMGAIFPLTLSAVVGADAHLGRATGQAYAVNTLGNIIGSAASVFILLPLFGVEWGMRVASLAYILLALWLVIGAESSVQERSRNAAFAAALAVLIIGVGWPRWDIGKWTSGIFRMSMTRSFFPDGDFESANVIFHRDGMSTTVTVEEEDGVRWVKVNGKIDGSSEGDMPTQILSGVLPLLFHPAPRNIAVIGCGSGVTVGSTLAADPETVVLIEIESEVVEAARLFESVNHAPWRDPRVTIVEDDGRNFMRRGGDPYDVIISEPSNPWMTGAASLFTVEFFEIAAARLKQDGMFLQWLQIYELAPERIASMLATFNSVFPHVLVFSTHADSNDMLLLGSKQPWKIEWQQLEKRCEEMSDELHRAEIDSPEELLALLLFTDRDIAELLGDAELNTDDNALIEFGAPRDLLNFAQADPDIPLLAGTRGRRSEMLGQLITDNGDWGEHLSAMARGYLSHGMLPDAVSAANGVIDGDLDVSDAGLERAKDILALIDLFEEEDQELVIDGTTAKADRQYARLAQLIHNEEEDVALGVFEEVEELQRRGGAYDLIYGYLLYREGESGAARRALLRARKDENNRPHGNAIAYYLARASFEAGEYERAVDEMANYRETVTRNLSRNPSPD